MQSLNRKSSIKPAAITQLALMEQQEWEMELAARKAARPLPLQPHWVSKAAKWSA